MEYANLTEQLAPVWIGVAEGPQIVINLKDQQLEIRTKLGGRKKKCTVWVFFFPSTNEYIHNHPPSSNWIIFSVQGTIFVHIERPAMKGILII